MTALVIAEHKLDNINDETLRAISAASKLSNNVNLLILGNNLQKVVSHAKAIETIKKVLVIEHEDLADYQAEVWADQVTEVLIKTEKIKFILISNSSLGKDLLPRIASYHDSEQISDVVEIIDDRTFLRPIYAGNLLSKVSSKQELNFLTVRANRFVLPKKSHGSVVEKNLPFSRPRARKIILKKNGSVENNRIDINSAKVVVSGGRGLGSAENYQRLLLPLATKLEGALGASRAAVDLGFAPNENQVGQTGKIVAPDLYIAVGLSGSVQHLAGMKDSKIIVAINKDPEAPIFKVATYGMVADLFDVIPELTEKIGK